MAKQHLTQEQKDKMKAAQKATNEFRKAPDSIALVSEFGPAFQRLEAEQRDLVSEVGYIMSNMITAVDTPETAEGKQMLMKLVGACTTSSYLRQVAGQWAGVILGRQDVTKVTTFKELAAAAKIGNEAIGVKPRGKRVKAQQPEAKVYIWPSLDTVLASEAGRAELRRFLNQRGLELTGSYHAVANDVLANNDPLPGMEQVSVQGKRQIRKAA